MALFYYYSLTRDSNRIMNKSEIKKGAGIYLNSFNILYSNNN